MYILIFPIIIALIFFIYFRKTTNKPPGPWCLPILGYLPWINPEKPYETLTQLSHKFGPIYGIWMGNVYTVVLTDPKIIRQVFIKDCFSGRAPLYLTHGIMKGYGLICAEGDLWKDQRKFVHSCLRNFGATKSSLNKNKLEEIIKTGVIEFLQTLNVDENANIPIDFLPFLRHCLGNVINAFVFGCTWSSEDDLWNWLQILQEEGTKHIGVGGPINFLPFLRFLPKYKRILQFLMDGKIKTHKVYQSLIENRKRIIEANPEQEHKNLIDAFLAEREKRIKMNEPSKEFYNDQQFYHLLADIFGASLDTTLTTLRWFFLFMAAFPQEQMKVQEELDAVLNGRIPDFEDILSLPFTEAALAETQRIRSVVPVGIPHGTLSNTEIMGFYVPEGTMIVPLQWAIHMDPKYWTNPNLYNPSRFLDDEGKFSKPDCFIPFQTGKRMCIGEDLARMLLFLFGASVIQQYHISCPPDKKIDLNGECGITLTPKKHSLVFTLRHK